MSHVRRLAPRPLSLPFVPRFCPLLTAASGSGNRLSPHSRHMADFPVLEGEMSVE